MVITSLAIVAGIGIAGGYLRWAVLPVCTAFELGRRTERILHDHLAASAAVRPEADSEQPAE
jgi:hypothetical protein